MDNSKQLTQHTTYGYDLNGNLITVNQGGQTRTFKYDSLSRLTYERTPEEDGTITDSPGGPWSAKYTYTSFNALEIKKDARG
jgi:YD repeat-containing protein